MDTYSEAENLGRGSQAGGWEPGLEANFLFAFSGLTHRAGRI